MQNVYPIFFGTQDALLGNGFVALVTVNGRALMFEEDGSWWVVGVQPAGVAGEGDSQNEAYLAFRDTIRKVLLDSAQLTASFDEFRADVEALFRQISASEAQRWEAAREAVRSGKCRPEDDYVAGLPRQTADPAAEVKVIQVAEPKKARPTPAPAEVQAAA